MIEVGFGFGSNIGDKAGHVRRAMTRLFGGPEVRFLAASSLWRTPPWGYEDQDWFVNACAVGETRLDPPDLLAFCKEVEAELGRETTFRWGPRVIDVDILYYGDRAVHAPDLAIPHKDLFNRAFVLVPLAEIRPKLVLSGRSVPEAAEAFDDPLEVIGAPWAPEG